MLVLFLSAFMYVKLQISVKLMYMQIKIFK